MSMRLVLVGQSSFIARHVLAAAHASGIDTRCLNRVTELEHSLTPADIVLNFTLTPAYQRGEYAEENDCDLIAARFAAAASARTVMLSTRRVYPAEFRWNAPDGGPMTGDETEYGQNKAHTEKAVVALSSRNAVLRLANIFGMEYQPGGTRRTFFAQMLRRLKQENTIYYDMHPDTQRDFLPVENCANGLVAAVRDGVSGILNLGSGFPTPCGKLADWVCEGFGGGSLVVDPPVVRDEFFLDMSNWNARFGPVLKPDALREYCVGLGRKLLCIKS